ncbi:MAG TPA: tandem-95 repeat protein, partial [Sedimenticola thiotaurini]|nr:tandem-95 repeat protein [Sedimenticola thiotaurini]
GTAYAAGATATLPGIGTLTMEADGTYSFTPVADYNGSVPAVSYEVSDGQGGVDSSTLQLTVTAVNDAPEAVADLPPVAVTVGVKDGVDHGWGDVTLSADSGITGVGAHVSFTGSGVGVVSSSDNRINQIEHRADGSSESLTVDFGHPVQSASFGYNRLFNSGAEQGPKAEQGKWVALLGGVEVASGSFIADAGQIAGTVDIDTGGLAFDAIRFEAMTYADGSTLANDSSDYMVRWVEATGSDSRVTTGENSPLTIAPSVLLANDSDPDGDALGVTSVAATAATQGNVTLDASGNVIYDPGSAFDHLAFGEVATDTFSYTISDGNGGTDTATVTVTIVGENDPPVAVDDMILTNIVDGSSVPVPGDALLANDSDVEGDPLSVTSTSNPVEGALSGSDPVEFTPNYGFGTSATTLTEADLYSGTDSEGNPLNNDASSAIEFGRNLFGMPSTQPDASGYIESDHVADPSLASARFIGEIRDLASTTGVNDQDWIKVSLRAGETIILDIDFGDDGDRNVGTDDNDVDTEIALYDANGTRLAYNDDSAPGVGGDGSVKSGYHSRSLDSFLSHQVDSDGDYYIRVGAYDNSANGVEVDNGNYQLWMSIQDPQLDSGSFEYSISDGNGGMDTAAATIEFVDAGQVNGTDANEILVGHDGAGSILDGGAGDDVLIGGDAADVLTGGSGADVFVVQDNGSAVDRITDYNAAEGDVLNLADLLSGTGVSDQSIGDYVKIDANGDLMLDPTGSGTFSNNPADAISHLDGVGAGDTVTLLIDDQTAVNLTIG